MHFEEKWGNAVVSGWLGIAMVETESMEARSGGRILKEKSSTTVNGEEVDHFKIGKRVKLAWPAEEKEEKTAEEED